MLTQVKLDDDSSFTFHYTTWGQVNQIAHYAADNHLLNYVTYNLPADAAAAQTDCPRFTQQRMWAEHWNGADDGAPETDEEAVIAYNDFDFAVGVASATTPDGTVHKEFYETSGWKKGLTKQSETWALNETTHVFERMKWTVFEPEHDGANDAPTPTNLRVKETRVRDSQGNNRRTRVVYTSFGLPQEVFEYDADATTVLRRTHVTYLPASVTAGTPYTGRRIIGLPEEVNVYGRVEGQERLASKVTFEYDLDGEFLNGAGTPTQHKSDDYGDDFFVRGNVCRVKRWDADDPDNADKTVKTETGYNTTGSAIFSRDALNHTTAISYADSNGTGNTLAYPTRVTDPDNFFSTAEYNYGLGLVTRTVDQKGAASRIFYDARGRREKVKSEVNGAYSRWEYAASGRYVRQFTIVDTGKPETFTASVFDGAGRLRGTLRKLPANYAAQRFSYDAMGRQVKQSNPTEVSIDEAHLANVDDWEPEVEDETLGWSWTSQTYDWQAARG